MTIVYFFVEGSDDRRFLERIVVPLVKSDNVEVTFFEYASKVTKDVNNLIRSLDSMYTEYIFVADKDNHPCITQKKDTLRQRYTSLRSDRIAIVDREIESWYISGATERACRRLKLRGHLPCEAFIKENFESLLCKSFPTTLALINDILSDFAFDQALAKSASFRYLIDKKIGTIVTSI